MKNIKWLEKTYFIFLFVIFFLVILTPYIIRSKFLLFEEEFLEAAMIVVLFGVGYLILKLYRWEVINNLEELEKIKRERRTLESRLTEAFQYIGTVNVQISEIRSVFSDINKFPESRKDFKYIMEFMAEKILGIVNVDWVMLRIIDTKTHVTLREINKTRGQAILSRCKVNNSELLEKKGFPDYKIISSSQKNFHIKTFCFIPQGKFSQHQEDLIKGITNQLEMIFIIFSSNYYKNF